nr:isoform 2 of btb/poz domain-containing protein pob1 [Quercus suber]
MRDSNADLFDPRTIMDSDCATGSLGPGPVSDSDFAFAFNDSNFSDRVLRIEIIPDLPETKSNGDGCTSIADWARNRKRRREDIKKDSGYPRACCRKFWTIMVKRLNQEQCLMCKSKERGNILHFPIQSSTP